MAAWVSYTKPSSLRLAVGSCSKVLPSPASSDPRQCQRFQVEAQAAALLHHENIVPVFGIGSDEGIHYYAMQFIDGRSLTEVIRELGGVPPRCLR